jgi:DNA polymerase-3 subunit epsilon
MEFISGAELIIHNAPFDLSFLNHELALLQQIWHPITEYCQIIDTLLIARQLHVGQRNSLDALCKRYGIDNSKRDLHGALLDANLLAQVYLAMTGGQGSFFDSLNLNQSTNIQNSTDTLSAPVQKYNLIVLKANEHELSEHQKYLQNMKQQHGRCRWLDD